MKRGRRAAIMACCGAMLMAAGCSRPPLTDEQSRALAAAEARWKTSAVRDYSFELRPFYSLAFDQCAARIEVRGGVVKQVTRLGSLEPTVMTIDDQFRRIHGAAARAASTRRSRRTTTATSAIRRGSSSERSPR